MPILCLDFDGVVHSYSSGWAGADVIPDPPVEGVFAFIATVLDAGWEVCIFSSRSHQHGGKRAMQRWLREHAGNMWYDSPAGKGIENVTFPDYKPSALVTIDDRAICFTGEWPSFDSIKNFKPWNKK